MIDEADEFSGQRSDCYIVVLPSFQLLEESGQPGIAHSCYNMCNLNKYRSEILGALLCDSTGSLFARRFVFSWIKTTPFGQLFRTLEIPVITDLCKDDRSRYESNSWN